MILNAMIIILFKQRTAYEMRISDWSSDVCSSDLRVEHHRRKIGDFHAHGLEVEARTDRVLHPGVGDQYPQGREVGAQRGQPGDGEVLQPAQAIPAEEEQSDQGAFEEERHQPLYRQRRAEEDRKSTRLNSSH